MAGLDVTAAEQAIANVASVTVKNAAQAAIKLAQASGNQNLVNAVDNVLGLSATGNGTAIFYSNNQANYTAAQECNGKTLGPSNSYIWQDTEAGAYASSRTVLNGLNGAAEQNALQLVASAMMGAQAKGPIIAFVGGVTDTTSQWFTAELPALLESRQTVINSQSSIALSTSGNSLTALSAQIGKLAQCFSQDNNPPPTGGSPVTPPIGSVSNTALQVGLGLLAAVGVGALVVFGSPGLVSAAVVAGVGLLVSTASASAAPKQPVSNDSASLYLYNSQLQAYNAAQIAPGLAYILTSSQVASGALPSSVLDQISHEQSSLTALKNFLAGSSAPLFTQLLDNSGNAINVLANAGLNGTINLNLAVAGPNNSTTAGSTSIIAALNSNGSLAYQQTTVTSATGVVTADISGRGDVTNLSNATIALTPGSSATIVGAHDTVTASGGAGYGARIASITVDGVTYSLVETEATASGNNIPVTLPTTSGPGVAVSDTSGSTTTIPFDTPSGAVVNAWLTGVTVANLGAVPLGSLPFVSDPTGAVAGGLIISEADMQVVYPTVNFDGVFNNSPSSIVDGYWRPANQVLADPSQNLGSIVGGAFGSLTGSLTSYSYFASLADASSNSSSWVNTDPLVIDIAGTGIALTSWIRNSVYFDTIVNPTTFLADGKQHHTSWVGPGSGIVALDLNGDGKINDITETLSASYQGGPTPGHYADGLAALASLATAGATVFSAATSKIDPKTGKSWFSEITVWQDANQNGVTDLGELKSLTQLGIASISLAGSGNRGELLNGSSVTNRATYTMSNGSTAAVAAVDFTTNTLGDVMTTANGGVLIQSTPDGGGTPTTSFVAKNATAHAYTLSNGKLTDNTTGAVIIASGATGMFSTNQNDAITVAASDTTPYWLGGGTGTDTLTGGAGNTVFLINSKTIVHGGAGFNIAEVTDGNPITVDLKTDHLQEVIGGAGDGVFNASGTTWNVFIQGGSGNNIIIGGKAHDALSGGTGDDLIEAGSGGSVIHAGSGNDVIYGGSGSGNDPTSRKPYSDIIYGGPGNDIVVLGTNNSVVYAGTGTMTLIGNSIKAVPGLGSQAAFSVLALHGSYADYTLTKNTNGTYTITDSVAGRDGAVTFSNISALDFSDVAQLPIANGLGLPVNDFLNTGNTSQVTTNSSGQYVVSAATLLANDKDYAGKTLSIRELLDNNGNAIARGGAAGQVNGGTAALSADGSTITFTPAAGYTGVMSFRYHVQDSSGAKGMGVYQLGTTQTAEMTATVYLNTPNMPTDSLFDKEWFLQAADIIPVLGEYTGKGVSVGIFDVSGNVDFSNPDLAPNAGGSVKIDGAPGIDQIGAHATLVAGVLGAAVNGAGAVGVASGATLYSEAVGPAGAGAASGANFTNLLDWSHYDVVNNSFGLTPPFHNIYLSNAMTSTVADALQNAVKNGRGGLGTIVVVGGGNDRSTGQNTNDFPLTNSPYEITVGGINAKSDLAALQISGAPFSNAGYSILVSAPANNITSDGVSFTNEYGQQFGASSQTAQGTSFATPIVSGVVADMLQANPNLNWQDVQEILALSAVKVDPADTNPFVAGSAAGTGWSLNGATNWNGGGLHYSPDYGFGEVDARAAIRLAETWQAQTGLTALTLNSQAQLFVSGVASPNYSSDSNGLVLPTNRGSATPYIDFNASAHFSGLDFTTEHIDVTVDLKNVILGNITISLVSKSSGEASLLFDGPLAAAGGSLQNAKVAQDFLYTFDTVQDWGEQGIGDWQLVVAYAAGTQPQGELTSAAVTLYGHGQTMGTVHGTNVSYVNFSTNGNFTNVPSSTVPGSATLSGTYTQKTGQTYYYTDEFGSLANGSATRATLNDKSAPLTIDAAAITTNSYIDLVAGSSDSFLAGHNLAIASGSNVVKAFGGDGNDTFIANSSNDTFYGGRGSDTYVFNSGFGQDTVINGVATNTSAQGKIVFGSGITADKLWFSQNGNNLTIQLIGTSSKVVMNGWFKSIGSQLSSINLSNGIVISGSTASRLAQAGSAYQTAHPTFNPANLPFNPGPVAATGTTIVGHSQTADETAKIKGLITPRLPGDTETVTAVSATAGTVSLANGVVSYIAPASGTGSIAYTVTDEFGESASGTLVLKVDPGPSAAPGAFKIGQSQIRDITSLIASYVTPGMAGDSETISAVSTTAGTIKLANGVVTYASPASGTASISYSVTDQLGDVASNSIAVTIGAGPSVKAGTLTIGHGQTSNITGVISGLIIPGQPSDIETITAISASTGTVNLVKGVVTYTAPASGSDSLSYTVTDQLGNTAMGKVAITVDPGPVTKAGTLLVNHGTVSNITSLINSLVTAGLPGDAETITAITATAGTISLVNGVATYTAPAGGAGAIRYTVSDHYGDTSSNNIAVTVDPGPKAQSINLSVGYNTLYNSIDPLTSQSPNGRTFTNLTNLLLGTATPGLVGDALSIVAVNTSGTFGAVKFSNGTVSYNEGPAYFTAVSSPTHLYNDRFTYTIADQYGNTATATANISIVDPAMMLIDGNGAVVQGNPPQRTRYEMVLLKGYGNSFIGNGGNYLIDGGDGGGTQVQTGNGNAIVSLHGSNNNVALGTGNDTVVGGVSNDAISVSGGNATLYLSGTGDNVNVNAGNAQIFDIGKSLNIDIGANAGNILISGFPQDSNGLINLIGGSKLSAQNLVNLPLYSDGQGGSILKLSATSSIDFVDFGPSHF